MRELQHTTQPLEMTQTTMESKKTFILISPKNRTVYNFRGDLIREIIGMGYRVIVTGPNRVDVERIEALGAEFVEIPNDKNGVSVTADLKYLYRLFALMRQMKPDVTLGYTIKPVIYGAIAARIARVGSINSMITGVGYLFISRSAKAKLLKALVLLLYRVGLAAAHRVVFQNRDDRDEFVANRLVGLHKTHLVSGSGVNMEQFAERPLPSQITFFMLSRAMYSKGVMEYAQAAKRVKALHPEVRFMFLGAFENIQDSIDEEGFRAEFVESGVMEYFGESDNIPQFYEQASVYVLPSYREGTPRTVLEAMSMGRAIITTDTPGCRECVIDGESGLLIAVKSVDAVAEAMLRFIEHPELISQMGAASKEYCYNRFRVEVVNQQMMNIMLQ